MPDGEASASKMSPCGSVELCDMPRSSTETGPAKVTFRWTVSAPP